MMMLPRMYFQSGKLYFVSFQLQEQRISGNCEIQFHFRPDLAKLCFYKMIHLSGINIH
jgi:hypothetical protein